MTMASELPHPPVPGEAARPPITMLNADFPFSYDHYRAHPAGLTASAESSPPRTPAAIWAAVN